MHLLRLRDADPEREVLVHRGAHDGGRDAPHLAHALGAEGGRAPRILDEDARLAEEPAGKARPDQPRAARRLLEPNADEPALHDEDVLGTVALVDEDVLRGEGTEHRRLREAALQEVGEASKAPGAEHVHEWT